MTPETLTGPVGWVFEGLFLHIKINEKEQK